MDTSQIKIIKENPLGTRPTWDEWFMHIIIGMASRSSCHNVHSASVIVADKKIIGEGYNGAPSSIENNCIQTGCRKLNSGLKYEESLNSGFCIGIHSEMNALGHLSNTTKRDITIYNTIFPCHSCAKNLLAYNLKRLVFKSIYSEKEFEQTMRLLQEAGVEVCQLDLSLERDLDIRYNNPNVRFDVWNSEQKEKIKNLLKDN